MTWESVKGFCRRHTQSFNEHYRHSHKTVDEEVETSMSQALQFQQVVERTNHRLGLISTSYENILYTLDAIRDDYSTLRGEQFELFSKRMDFVTRDLHGKLAGLKNTFEDVRTPMDRFGEDCAMLQSYIDDRKAKMLELDFFINKVAKLKANPPSDTTRIPRNEGRLMDWTKRYGDANDKVKQTCGVINQSGQRLLFKASNALTTESGAFCAESGKSMRAAFGLDGVQASLQTSQVALAAVQQQAYTAAAQGAQNATAAAAGTAVATKQSVDEATKAALARHSRQQQQLQQEAEHARGIMKGRAGSMNADGNVVSGGAGDDGMGGVAQTSPNFARQEQLTSPNRPARRKGRDGDDPFAFN